MTSVFARSALASFVAWANRSGWPVLLGRVTLASLMLTILALWASVIGLVIDIALLATVASIVSARRRRAAAS